MWQKTCKHASRCTVLNCPTHPLSCHSQWSLLARGLNKYHSGLTSRSVREAGGECSSASNNLVVACVWSLSPLSMLGNKDTLDSSFQSETGAIRPTVSQLRWLKVKLIGSVRKVNGQMSGIYFSICQWGVLKLKWGVKLLLNSSHKLWTQLVFTFLFRHDGISAKRKVLYFSSQNSGMYQVYLYPFLTTFISQFCRLCDLGL